MESQVGWWLGTLLARLLPVHYIDRLALFSTTVRRAPDRRGIEQQGQQDLVERLLAAKLAHLAVR